MKIFILLVCSLFFSSIMAKDNSEEIAKQLANPIASLISVPFDYNYFDNIGPDDKGTQSVLMLQPLIPFSLNSDWNVISRTIMPIIDQKNITPGSGSQSGLGDTLQTFFFSPKKLGPSGLIWGAGPAFLLPTASDDLLGGGKWGAGAAVVVLKQKGPWTIGTLVNQIWSVGGDKDREDLNYTYFEPFASYTTPKAVTYSIYTESTYDWVQSEWSIPIVAQVAKVFKIGEQSVSIGIGVRYWVESTEIGPEGWSANFNVRFAFPK